MEKSLKKPNLPHIKGRFPKCKAYNIFVMKNKALLSEKMNPKGLIFATYVHINLN